MSGLFLLGQPSGGTIGSFVGKLSGKLIPMITKLQAPPCPYILDLVMAPSLATNIRLCLTEASLPEQEGGVCRREVCAVRPCLHQGTK